MYQDTFLVSCPTLYNTIYKKLFLKLLLTSFGIGGGLYLFCSSDTSFKLFSSAEITLNI